MYIVCLIVMMMIVWLIYRCIHCVVLCPIDSEQACTHVLLLSSLIDFLIKTALAELYSCIPVY